MESDKLFTPKIKKAIKMLVDARKIFRVDEANGRHGFRFVLAEEVVRKMNKKLYKDTMHWLRAARRIVEEELSAATG